MPAPTISNGKICYLEIPTDDIQRSVDFYRDVFGWEVRQRPNGSTAFDDTTKEVSGSWVVGRPPSTDAGLLVYIMVDSVEDAMRAVEDHGGAVVQPIGADAPEITARFTDPYGNLIGLYQEPAPTTSA